ncbi:MAG: hypothetical protein IT428_27410 [Planctomycetaceae bacterium]|nr:hypothetical protein [Planctomycetaceae bacterium]
MFSDRNDAARRLADLLRRLTFRDPLILAIPRGGMIVGTTLSRELGFDLDVLLCRKLRPRGMDEEIAAVSESGAIAFDRSAPNLGSLTAESLVEDRAALLTEITRQRSVYRALRPAARIANRSILITDDGVVSGTTMAAALNSIRRELASEVVVAVPVGQRDALNTLRRRCDRLVCALEVDELKNLKDVYSEFPPVSDDDSIQIYRSTVLK